jgi:homoserine dehydrogenase
MQPMEAAIKRPLIRVGMLGAGTVGSAVYRQWEKRNKDLSARADGDIEFVAIAVRTPSKSTLPSELLTTDFEAVVNDPTIEIVVELMGGIEPARTLILTALKNGKSVVTANKALLAVHADELFQTAESHGVDLYYEGAVAGAIPILRPLRESLIGDKVVRFMGIVNGTTNYILTKMQDTGAEFATALAEAQKLGYAEADPTADIEGYDAAAKAAILASLAFHTRVDGIDVNREGITALTPEDFYVAKQLDMVIKLLAIGERTGEDEISVRVHPTMIPNTHPLAAVRDAFNAVFVQGESAGELMFYGRGAGGEPTASAVLGDLVAIARHKVMGVSGAGEWDYADHDIAPDGKVETRELIRLHVRDLPGVLESVAHAFATEGVSINTVRQNGKGDDAELIVATHPAREGALDATIERLSTLPVVKEVLANIRIEGV